MCVKFMCMCTAIGTVHVYGLCKCHVIGWKEKVGKGERQKR